MQNFSEIAVRPYKVVRNALFFLLDNCSPLTPNVVAAWRSGGSLLFMRGAKLANLYCFSSGIHRHLRETAR